MGAFWGHRFRRTTLQLALFLSILAGLAIVRLYPSVQPAPLWLVIGLAGVCTMGVQQTYNVQPLRQSKNKKRLMLQRGWLGIMALTVLGVHLGCWRGAIYAQKLSEYDPYYYQNTTLTATAAEDATYNQTKQLSFMAGSVQIDGGKLTGKVLLGGFGANAVFKGDEIVAEGKLYPGRGAYQGRMSFAKITVTDRNPSVISELRRKFVAGMQSALPEPQAPFAMGLLVGQRATLPEEIKQDLLMVGLTHIIAVSGYNLTIIMHASRRAFGRLSKRISTVLSLGLIGVFLLLTGGSASIVRASIVSVLGIWAAYYGRSIKPLNLLALTAVITAWANPVYLWSDLSWHLSFLAFFGVMVLAPLIQKRWPGKWHQSLIGTVALESICAEVMSLPFVLHVFGQMSLVGLPANVLVVTMVPLAMLLGLVAGLAGMLISPVCGWLAWPATQLLTYMLDIAHLMARLPHIFIEHRTLPLMATLAMYGLIICLVTVLWHKTKSSRSAIITDRNVRSQQMVNY